MTTETKFNQTERIRALNDEPNRTEAYGMESNDMR